MTKKQIHPLIDEKDDETLKLFNVKPSEAIKRYADTLRTSNTDIDNKIEVKKQLIQYLKEDRQKTDNKIKQLEKEIAELETNKTTLADEMLNDYKQAKEVLDKRFESIEKDIKNNKWGIKRMEIKELEDIAIKYRIPANVLLTDYPRSRLEKVLENYRKYS